MSRSWFFKILRFSEVFQIKSKHIKSNSRAVDFSFNSYNNCGSRIWPYVWINYVCLHGLNYTSHIPWAFTGNCAWIVHYNNKIIRSRRTSNICLNSGLIDLCTRARVMKFQDWGCNVYIFYIININYNITCAN